MIAGPDPRALELVGIPFQKGGTDFRPVEGGTDCLQVTLEFRRRIGLPAPSPWDDVETRLRCRPEDLPPCWRPVAADCAPELGDVAVTPDGRHVGVYVGGGLMLHATLNCGTMLAPVGTVPVDGWWRVEP